MLQGAKIPQVSEDFFFGQFPCLKKGFRTEKKIDNLADWHQTAEAVGHTVPVVRNAWHTCRLSLWCVIQLFLLCGWKQYYMTHMQIVFVMCDPTVPVLRVKAALHDTHADCLCVVWFYCSCCEGESSTAWHTCSDPVGCVTSLSTMALAEYWPL